MANAGIDQSNVAPAGRRRTRPAAAGRSRRQRRGAARAPCRRYRRARSRSSSPTASAGRGGAARSGVAIGAAGLPALLDLRGHPDLFGRILQVSIIGLADEIAAAASLVMGQADEAQPVVLVRGLAGARPPTRPPSWCGRRAKTCSDERRLVVALSGGVGGAKLALGLSRVLPPEELLVVANTGDDFEHLGLSISPDIDTLIYALAGLDNPVPGWGRRDETWSFMETIGTSGGEDWFRLGDRDLALHVERTRRLRAGETLSAVTADICRRLGVGAARAADERRSGAHARAHRRGLDRFPGLFRAPAVPAGRARAGFRRRRRGARRSRTSGGAASGKVRAVVICPSNPFISIEPILAVPGLRAALAGCGAPVVAVSPIIGGRAVKGPTAKMMQELGLPVERRDGRPRGTATCSRATSSTRRCRRASRAELHVAPTLMTTLEEREPLARTVLGFADFARVSAPPTSGPSCPSRSWTAPSSVSPPCSRPPNAARSIEVMMGEVLEAVARRQEPGRHPGRDLDPRGDGAGAASRRARRDRRRARRPYRQRDRGAEDARRAKAAAA